MKKLVFLIALIAFMASAPFAIARDTTRDSLMHTWKQQKAQEKRWEAVTKAKTPAARQQALQNYVYNQPREWQPAP